MRLTLRQPWQANRLFAAIDDAAAGEPLGKPSAPPDRRRTRSIEPLEPRRVLDSTVVFNEVMYNPPGPTDDALEWIELSNQMAVDMDLSGWRLDGGVEFQFPFNVRFHPDALFRGVHESVAIDRSGRGGTASQTQDEILIKHITNASGSIGGMYDDLVRFIAPNPVHTRTALLLMARFGDEFIDTQFEDGGEGTVFKLDIAYVPNGTTNGNPQSPKLPFPYHHPPAKDLADFGDDKEAYRRHLLIRNNRAADDYSGIIAVSQALSLSGARWPRVKHQQGHAAANADPLVGPVVIHEIMYNPSPGPDDGSGSGSEFVELLNISGAPVSLAGWHFSAISYTFAADVVITGDV